MKTIPKLVLNEGSAEPRFSRVTCNLMPAGCRMDTLEGREYTVVPMVILTEGVHTGSMGPLYYGKDELGKTPAVWNHKPIVVYHPTFNGESISACDPTIINSRKVGIMLNTRYEGGRLKSEAWIDKERANTVDERIMAAVDASEMMELSTGVFIDIEDEAGDWKGEKYQGIARNFRPDHLALLPDQIGACSIADGAGFIRNAQAGSGLFKGIRDLLQKVGLLDNQLSFSDVTNQLDTALNEKFNPHNNTPVWVRDVFSNFVVYSVNGDLYRISYSATDSGVTLGDETPVAVYRVTEYRTTNNEAMINNVTKSEGDGKHPSSHYLVVGDPQKPTTWHLRVRDASGKLDHRLMGAAWAALHGGYRGNKYAGPNKAQAISKLKALYKSEKLPLPGSGRANNEEQNQTMNKKQKIDAIIAANRGWGEGDREALVAMNDNQVQLVFDSIQSANTDGDGEGGEGQEGQASGASQSQEGAAAAEGDQGAQQSQEGQAQSGQEGAATPPATQSRRPATVKEYIDQAPREIQEVLNTGLSSYNTEKQGLVKRILENKNNAFTKQDLEGRPLKELRNLARLCGADSSARTASYAGQGLAQQSASEGEGEPVLEVPTMNFAQSGS